MANSSTGTSIRPALPPAAGSSTQPAPLRGGEDPAASLKEFGSSTTVPHNDICRLSYYLKCCILGCGFGEALNAVPVEVMMDYNNAHHLPTSLQQAIYHIVMSDFHPHKLMNQVFFVDDSSTLLEPETMNAFFEWSTTISRALRMVEQGSSFLGGSSDEQGQQATSPNSLRKLMVCTSSWLNEYCILPLYRLSERLATRGAALSFSSIAAAVSGGEASALAARNARDRRSFLFLSDHQEQYTGYDREQHPQAFSSRSAARFCSVATSSCRQNHFTSSASPVENEPWHHSHPVVCGGSNCVTGGVTPIRGPRYRCSVCPSFDLCEICYNDLAGHDQTHAFEMIATSRIGVRPRLLQARVRAVTECCSSTLCNNERQEDVPIAFAVPIVPHDQVIGKDDDADGPEQKHKRRRL